MSILIIALPRTGSTEFGKRLSINNKFKYEFEILENPKNKKETKHLKKLVGDIIMEFLNDKYSEDQTNEYVKLDGGETDTLSTVDE